MRRGIATVRFLAVPTSGLLAGVLLIGVPHVVKHPRSRRFVTVAVMHGEPTLAAEVRELTLAPQDLPGVTLTVCRLVGDWRGYSLRGSRLWECDLREAVLYDTPRCGLAAARARLLSHRADICGSLYGRRTRWPPGFDPQAHGAVLVGQWVGIAMLRPMDDKSAEKARTALEAGGISPVLMSHLGIHLKVPARDRARALELLERDAAEHGYWIRTTR